jgi:hypothetical protein
MHNIETHRFTQGVPKLHVITEIQNLNFLLKPHWFVAQNAVKMTFYITYCFVETFGWIKHKSVGSYTAMVLEFMPNFLVQHCFITKDLLAHLLRSQIRSTFSLAIYLTEILVPQSSHDVISVVLWLNAIIDQMAISETRNFVLSTKTPSFSIIIIDF